MSRPVVGVPFNPALLAAEGEIHPFPETPDFDPAGSWSLTYRLVGARGFKGENDTVGWVCLKRSVESADRFHFEVESRLVMQEAMQNEIQATAICAVGTPATAVRWKHVSGHRDTQGNPLPTLRLEQHGEVRDGRIEIHIEKHRHHPELRTPWTTEFLLFETLQRMPFSTGEPLRFDLFEDFSLIKKDHRIHYRGSAEHDLGGGRQTPPAPFRSNRSGHRSLRILPRRQTPPAHRHQRQQISDLG